MEMQQCPAVQDAGVSMMHGEDGGYNDRSTYQRHIATSTLLPLLERAAERIERRVRFSSDSEPLLIMDCGCSQAALTRRVCEHFIACCAGWGASRPVHVLLSDTPDNDWATAFRVMTEPRLEHSGGVTVAGIGKSFYTELLPRQSLSLLLSTSSLHWLPPHCVVRADDSLVVACSKDMNVHARADQVSASLFSDFLRHRHEELKSGGIAVLSMYVSKTEGLSVIDVAMREMVDDGLVPSDVFKECMVPFHLPPQSTVMAAICSSKWKVHNEEVARHSFPAWNTYLTQVGTGLGAVDAAERYGEAFVKDLMRGFMEAVVMQWFASAAGDDRSSAQSLTAHYFERMKRVVRRNPLDWRTTTLTLLLERL